MKSLIMGCLLLIFCFSCSHIQKKQDSFATLTQLVDSARRDAKASEEYNNGMPSLERMEADEL
ncbi:MAG TPA: hypothetical protein H9819_01910, partial [Candidatus Bacteroides merdipullorum]|nr:hypothetical protein [Candidatus Bacteroides merdipullorum]